MSFGSDWSFITRQTYATKSILEKQQSLLNRIEQFTVSSQLPGNPLAPLSPCGPNKKLDNFALDNAMVSPLKVCFLLLLLLENIHTWQSDGPTHSSKETELKSYL